MELERTVDAGACPRVIDRTAWLLLGSLLFALVLFPAVLQREKALLSGGLMVLFVARTWSCRGRSGLASPVLFWFAFYIFLGAAFILLGLGHRAAGTGESLRVYVFAPLLFLAVAGLVRAGTWRRVETILDLATLGVGLLVILRMLALFGRELPLLGALVGLYPDAGFVSESGSTPRVLSTLVFLGPFAVARLLVARRRGSVAPLLLQTVTAAVALVAVLLSRRNAILLSTAAVPIVVVILTLASQPRRMGSVMRRLGLLTALGGLVLGLAGGVVAHTSRWDPTGLAPAVRLAFDPGREQGARTRLEQMDRLLASAAASPLWGHGLGTQAGAYVRDPVRPWRYEIRHLSLAHAAGFGGLGLFAAGVVWVYGRGLALVRRGDPLADSILAMLAALFCVLLSEWTNAYLGEVGHLWMFFLPVTVVNAALVAGNRVHR